jgi:HlyD family secretion protein
MKLSRIIIGVTLLGAIAGGLMLTGRLPVPERLAALIREHKGQSTAERKPATVPPPAVTVVRANPGEFVATVLVTGSLVAREEILVGPEIEGLRVVEVLADEGDRVKKGQVLARLVSATLEAQLAQNTAALARSEAAIAQAHSAISSAKARLEEARNAYDRAKPLTKSGFLSESGMDQRQSAMLTSEAALASAQHGLKLAEAEKAQVEGQRREIVWRRQRTEIRAPADGLVSRRVARIGGYASGPAEPLFRIVANGEVELDAEVPETRLHQVRAGQKTTIEIAGAGTVEGVVRLVSPEVDRATRLGRVRVFIGQADKLKIGAFARGRIETGRGNGLVLPRTAVLYGDHGPQVQVVVDGRVATRNIELGLADAERVEVVKGLRDGELVVSRSGTFLREGDLVRPVAEGVRTAREAG